MLFGFRGGLGPDLWMNGFASLVTKTSATRYFLTLSRSTQLVIDSDSIGNRRLEGLQGGYCYWRKNMKNHIVNDADVSTITFGGDSCGLTKLLQLITPYDHRVVAKFDPSTGFLGLTELGVRSG